jgi:hypothetical protein
MRSIHGDFAMYRTKTQDGRNAIRVVPEPEIGAPLLHSFNEEDDSEPISFERVEDGENHPDSYLTVTRHDGLKVHFGPYIPRVT